MHPYSNPHRTGNFGGYFFSRLAGWKDFFCKPSSGSPCFGNASWAVGTQKNRQISSQAHRHGPRTGQLPLLTLVSQPK